MSDHEPLMDGNCITAGCPDHPFILEASDGSSFAHDALRFASAADAANRGYDLSTRWFGLRAYRVLDTRDGSISHEAQF